MLFFTIFVSLLLIGSTVAQTDAEMMDSLSLVHSHVSTYFAALSRISPAAAAILGSYEYLQFHARGGMILQALGEFRNNANVPNVASMPITRSSEQVIEEWSNAANSLFLKFLGSLSITVEAVPDNIRPQVLVATEGVRNRITVDPQILDMFKEENSGIFVDLLHIISICGEA